MLVRDVYEVLSSHRPVVRRGCWQQKFLQVQNVNRREHRQEVQASAENLSPKRKQPTEGNADSKSKHQLQLKIF
ncbi:hypothetical protein C0J52_11358 [Blattella germanica]|nr:hypothetical protein C0J52_11358 [Blattella germanica]